MKSIEGRCMLRMLFVVAVLSGAIAPAQAACPDISQNSYLLGFRTQAAANTARVAQFFDQLKLSDEIRTSTIMTSFGINEEFEYPFLRFEDYVATVAATMAPERLLSFNGSDPSVFGIKVILADKSEFDLFSSAKLGLPRSTQSLSRHSGGAKMYPRTRHVV